MVAVSGLYRGSPGGEESSPGIPRTNLTRTSTAVLNRPPGTPQKPTEQDDQLYYLDNEATSPSTLKPQAQKPYGRMCGSLCKIGEDKDGNGIVTRTACGREWCTDCRLIAHRRRIARSLTRLLQIDPMGYEVITFPLEVRLVMRNPSVLALKAKQTRQLYRKMGYRKIFTRWHYFGEHGEKYHPHLNVLYDGGYLSKEQLAKKKDLIRRKLLPRSIAKRIGKDLVIHSDYTSDPKLKMRWISYVMKASFTDRAWDEPLADALYGFHNGCSAGFWNDPPKWKLTGTDKKFNALLSIRKGIHPVSGKPIVWSKPLIPWALAQTLNLTHLEAWCYCYTSPRAPPLPPLDLSNLTELPDGDHRKHPNAVRRSIERARERVSFQSDYEENS
ncbi:hypothetical protein ES708_17678 [subsurface metagenome]